MSAGGGFWPGDEPPADEAQQPPAPEGAVVAPPGWLQPRTEERPAPEPPEGPAPPAAEPPEPTEPAGGAAVQPAPEPEPPEEPAAQPASPPATAHVAGELDIPDDVAVLEGSPSGAGRTVGIVVSRVNGEISDRLLHSALGALAAAGVPRERITVMPVPGAFELPIGAMALAKTRRYSCLVALGCVLRGETAHFEYVAGEAASGLQLAGLETGVPVAFGVLTVDTVEQAEARVGKGAEAARAALEMADLFA
ncbi:MAG TPA: 6,7-dimethyl-8-ribityllumazine synthase, partial [Gaiellaceae bacterium]|nr:6,7-dimethyl-8-ribityllumazine synthase [Gaiellaceae bacterium]